MYPEVKITKLGIKENNNKSKILTDLEILRCLQYDCILDDDITLRDLLLILCNLDDKLKEFIGRICWCNIFNYDDYLNDPPTKYSGTEYIEDIEYLEIDKTIYEDELEQEVICCAGFHGIGKTDKTINYGICNATDLLDKEIKLNNNLKINFLKEDFQSYINKKQYSEIYTSISNKKTSFKLIEIIYTVLYEISFYGSPEKTKETLDEIFSRTEDQDIEKAIPYKDIKEKFKARDKAYKVIRQIIDNDVVVNSFDELWEKHITKIENYELIDNEEDKKRLEKNCCDQMIMKIRDQLNQSEPNFELVNKIKKMV